MAVSFYPDIDLENTNIRKKVFASINDVYPIHGKNLSIDMTNLRVDKEPDRRDYSAMKKKRIREQDFSATVVGDLVVKDNKGKTILNMPKQRVLKMPILTPNLGFIVGGTEYQITTVPRLKSGAYPRIKRTGDLEVGFNLLQGKNMSMTFDPQSRKFSLSFIGSSRKVPLMPILETLGLGDSALSKKLGADIVASSKAPKDRTLASFYTATTGSTPGADMRPEQLEQHVRDTFEGTAIRSDTTKMVFGKAYNKVDRNLLLDSASRLLEINKGNAEPVNRDLSMFKEYYRPADLLADRIDRSRPAITRRVQFLLDRPQAFINDKELAPSDLFDGPVRAFFTMSQSSVVSNQYNPLSNINGYYRTSPLGEGGLSSLHVVTDEIRNVHRSGHGVVDPIQTPEGSSIGVTSFLATGFSPKDKDPATKLYNTKTKKLESVTPDKVMQSNIAFSDQFYRDERGAFKPVTDKVEAFGVGGDLYKIDQGKVDYVIPDQHSMYASALNVTPFIGSNHSVRGGMIYRHMDQALPLKRREQPLVQVMRGDSLESVEGDIGNLSAIRSPVSGTISRIGSDYIHVKSGNKTERVSIPRNFPLNDHKSHINATPTVVVGQKVKSGDLLADTNFTKDGVLSIGVNLRAAYVSIPGLNFEDGIVISQSAAQKMTSEHLYRKSADVGQDRIVDKEKFAQYVPTERDKLSKLDDEGVIRVGQRVEKGDVLATVLQKREFKDGLTKLAKMRSSFKRGLEWRDASLRWESAHPGVVTDVVKKRGGFNILIRTEEPAEVGDKLSNRHANKGIVTTVLPDDEMPHDAEGKPIEIALNPLTVPGRITDGQFGELGAAKAAQHDGDTVLVRNNDPHRKFIYFRNKQEVPVRQHERRIKIEGGTKTIEVKAHKRTVLRSVKQALDERGLSDQEELFVTKKDKEGQPKTESIGEIMVGPVYTMKLTHQVQKKMTARGVGPNYDASGAPLGGGSAGAQAIGGLGMFALLAHGAERNLQEMGTVKADASQREYWYALQRGEPLPKPEVSFAFKKFMAYLEALGLNVERKGTSLTLVPMRDREILARSSGSVDLTRVLAGHEYKPEKGGIFDEEITGGLSGTRWSHYSLAEPTPNPIFEDAIKALTGISTKQFQQIMGVATGPSTATSPSLGVGKTGELVDASAGVTGAEAISILLAKVNVAEDLDAAESTIAGTSGLDRDKLNKKIHILRALKTTGLTPDVYMTNNIPILPPVFRPIVKLPTGSLAVDDLNQLYRYLGETDKAIKEYPPGGDQHKLDVLRAHKYDLMKALAGTGGTVYDYAKDKPQGILAKIAGPSPKLGFFQSRVLKRKQDMTAASTIIPDAKMDLDEVGIPRELLYKAYEPLLVRQLALTNIPYNQATTHIENRTSTAENALQKVLSEYPLMLKRDPALHMYNILGFKPHPVEGRAIKIHPLVTSGYNADFDGDTMRLFIPSSKQAAEEVRKMFPSKILFNRGTDRPMYAPSMDSAIGLYLFSLMDKGVSPVTYGSKEAVIEDMTEREGNIKATQPIKIGKLLTTPGRIIMQSLFGDDIISDEDIGRAEFSMKKGAMRDYLAQVARKRPNDYPDLVDALKDVGFDSAQKSGLSFSLNEFLEAADARDTILDKYEGKVDDARKLHGDRRQKALLKVMDDTDKELRAAVSKLADKGNRPAQMLESGEKPSWSQFKQFMLSPVLSTDGDGDLVPELIRMSYGDGMSQGVHTLAGLPARASMVQKTVSVSGPGYLTKQIIVPAIDTRITEKDCKTKDGLDFEATSSEVLDRFLAKDVASGKHVFKAGTLVTPDIMGYVGNQPIKVRSPQTCASSKGICQKCMGDFPDGPPDIGTNIGIIAAQSIGERGTQLALRAFHSGGVDKAAVMSSFGRVEQLLRMPKILPNKAVLSEIGGYVSDVRRDPSTGARHVTIEGKEHFIPPRKKMLINRGMTVAPGQAITDGPKDPRELLKISGMPEVRRYLTDELHNIYKGDGIKRRMVETVVRGVTDMGIVSSTGGRKDLVPGDKVSLRAIESWNKGQKADDKVKIEPVLIGVNRLGIDYTTDWMSRLAFEHIKDTIIDAAQRGWKSDISGAKHLPRIAYGGDPDRQTL